MPNPDGRKGSWTRTDTEREVEEDWREVVLRLNEAPASIRPSVHPLPPPPFVLDEKISDRLNSFSSRRGAREREKERSEPEFPKEGRASAMTRWQWGVIVLRAS